MRADECEFHGIFIKRFVDCADIAGYVNASISFKNTAKRMVVQRGVEGVLSESCHPFLKTLPDFYRYLPVLLFKTAMEKNPHRRLR